LCARHDAQGTEATKGTGRGRFNAPLFDLLRLKPDSSYILVDSTIEIDKILSLSCKCMVLRDTQLFSAHPKPGSERTG
jgi:hypothetical protein